MGAQGAGARRPNSESPYVTLSKLDSSDDSGVLQSRSPRRSIDEPPREPESSALRPTAPRRRIPPDMLDFLFCVPCLGHPADLPDLPDRYRRNQTADT